VFVSHNLPAIVELCTKSIFIDHGRLVTSGTPGEVVQAYHAAASQGATPADSAARPDADIWIRRVELRDGCDRPADLFRTGDRMTVRIHYDTAKPVTSPSFGVDIHRADGIYCMGIGTRIDGEDFGTLSGPGHVDLTIDALQLLSGAYSLSIGIHRAGGCGDYDLRLRAYPLTVTSSRADLGVVWLEHTWRHVAGTNPAAATPARVEEVAVQ
jgi:lipopolysaccharide transport system ATP-binding protein